MKRKSIIGLFLVIIISFNFYFGFPRVKKFTGVDETLWSYNRIPKFWNSIAKHNWKKTDINDKPGITLAFISGAGLPFIPNPKNYSNLQFKAKTTKQLNTIENIYYYLRLPVYIFSLLSLIFFYLLTKRLLGYKTAIFATSFIGLSPILLGISLILNLDSLLWIFMPLSLISFLIYQKENNQKFLILSGFILGLALLTKYIANLLFPFFLLLIFFKYVFEKPLLKDKANYFKKSFFDYLILIISSLVTVSLFYPRIWVKFNTLLYTTIFSEAFIKIYPFFLGILFFILIDTFLLKNFFSYKISNFCSNYQTSLIKIISFFTLALIIFVFLNVYTGMKIYNFENIFFDPKGVLFLPAFLSSFFPLIFGSSPFIVLFFILTIFLLTKYAHKLATSNLKYAFYLLFFILIYYLANSLAGIGATIRYQIVIYPLAFIISAIGIIECFKIFQQHFFKINFYWFFSFFLISLIYALFLIRPFYFSYASILLPKQYILNPHDMGVGGWEASQYLNSLPNAKKLVVWSDKKQACEKFIGKCIASSRFNRIQGFNFDYFITSTVGGAKTTSYAKPKENQFKIGADIINPYKLYSTGEDSDFNLVIGNRPENFIRVTNLKKAMVKDQYLSQTHFNMPAISQPFFPDRVCNIMDYGAVSNDNSLDTQAFTKAITDCAQQGGGKVKVPPGIWLTGAIHLKSNIDLDLEKGAEIKFSPSIKNYLPSVFSRFEGMELYNYSPLIYANNCHNIAITGKGKINGQRKLWVKNKNNTLTKQSINKLIQLTQNNIPVKKRDFGKEIYFIQPPFIQFINCHKILIEGIYIENSPAWTIQPTYSHDISIKNITIHNDGNNTDGIDIDSSQNILIQNSTFNTGDDAIAIKSGRNKDGLRVNKPSQNIIIENCKVDFAHAALAIGSETSGGIKNIFVNNIKIKYADYGIRLKSNANRGGIVENIWINNINIYRVKKDAIQMTLNYGNPSLNYKPPKLPIFRNINISDLYCRRSHNAIVLTGLADSPLKNLTLKDINISAEKGIASSYLENKKFQNIKINTN